MVFIFSFFLLFVDCKNSTIIEQRTRSTFGLESVCAFVYLQIQTKITNRMFLYYDFVKHIFVFIIKFFFFRSNFRSVLCRSMRKVISRQHWRRYPKSRTDARRKCKLVLTCIVLFIASLKNFFQIEDLVIPYLLSKQLLDIPGYLDS